MNHAVFDCKQCGYSQAVDPVHIGTVFSCPTCAAVVMVTALEPPPAQEQTGYTPQQAAAEAEYAAQQAQAAQQQAVQPDARHEQQPEQQTQDQSQLAAQQAYHAAQQAQQYVQQEAEQAATQAAEAGYAEQAAEAAQAYAQHPAYSPQQSAPQYAAPSQEHQAQQPQYAAPQQQGFDPAMVAYQTGAVNSPVGVSVAHSHFGGGVVEPVAQPFESPGDPPLNVPMPDSRRSGSIFGNVLLFAVLYILFMAPYLLPYLKSFGIADLSLLESGSVLSPFTLKLVCSACLIIIALFRGLAIGKGWLLIFPVIAGVISFMPGLDLPSFVVPALHALTLALGVLMSPKRSRRLSF